MNSHPNEESSFLFMMRMTGIEPVISFKRDMQALHTSS